MKSVESSQELLDAGFIDTFPVFLSRSGGNLFMVVVPVQCKRRRMQAGGLTISAYPECLRQIGRCKDSDRSNGIRSLSDRAGSEINTVTVRRE